MKVFTKRCYESVVRDYRVYIDEDLAANMTEDLQKWFRFDKEVSVKMIEDIADRTDDYEAWDCRLIDKKGRESGMLSDYINDYLNEAAWEDYDPEIIDSEVHDSDNFVIEINY